MSKSKKNRSIPPDKGDVIEIEEFILHDAVKAVFKDQFGTSHADVRVGDSIITTELQSKMLEQVLNQAAYLADADIPKIEIEKVSEKIRTKAMFSNDSFDVGARILINGGSLYANCGEDGYLIRISNKGVKRVKNKSIRFRHSSILRALAYVKEAKADFELFNKFSPISKEFDNLLLYAWMIESFFVDTSFPILLITGPSGSGKSTLTRMIQDIIDPSVLGMQTPPSSAKDIVLGSIHAHLLVYNNVTIFTVEQQNLYCILSTGGNIPNRLLYTNSDINVTELCRPVMINGLFSPFTQDDVIARTIQINLPELTSKDYAKSGGEKQWKADFEADLPCIFKGFINMVQKVYAIRDSVELPDKLPRMTDYAITGIALEQVLELETGTFLKAYEDNLIEGLILVIDGSEVAQSVVTLAKKAFAPHTYTIKELLGELKKHSNNARILPSSARGLSQELRRIKKALSEVEGINLRFLKRSSDGYRVEIIPSNYD